MMMPIDGTLTGGAAQITALDAREGSLIQSSRTPTDAAKIEKGSKEFEAVLLGSWLQQAEQSFATIPGTDEDQDVGRDQIMSMGVQSLATCLAQSGALGIGKMIAKAMYHAVDTGDIDEQHPVPDRSGLSDKRNELK